MLLPFTFHSSLVRSAVECSALDFASLHLGIPCFCLVPNSVTVSHVFFFLVLFPCETGNHFPLGFRRNYSLIIWFLDLLLCKSPSSCGIFCLWKKTLNSLVLVVAVKRFGMPVPPFVLKAEYSFCSFSLEIQMSLVLGKLNSLWSNFFPLIFSILNFLLIKYYILCFNSLYLSQV